MAMSTPGTGPATAADERRFGVRCPRCARTQPPSPQTAYRCAYCGAPLPVRRWMAHPPPGLGPARTARLVRRPYQGPPGYGAAHPRWGFPPVIWRSATVGGAAPAGRARVRGLRPVTMLSWLAAIACVVAAGAEGWRFALLLAGRTEVLPGGPVRASDLLVLAAGVTALVLGAVTALAALPVLTTLHRVAAVRAGRRPARSAAAVLARLVVPGWNLYGAGLVLLEIDRSVRRPGQRRRRAGRLTVPLWWLAWVLNGMLVLAALIMAFWRSNQLMADTVEMHVAIDLAGAAVAGLFAVALARFDRALNRPGEHRYAGWSVRQPESTARNRAPRGDVPAGSRSAGTAGGDEDPARGDGGDEAPDGRAVAAGESAGDEDPDSGDR